MKGHPSFWKGKSLSIEHRANISAGCKGRTGHPHSAESREKIGAWRRGRKFGSGSESRRQKISVGRQAHIAAQIPNCKCGPCGGSNNRNTSIEIILRDRVLADFPEVQANVRFGIYEVDAYLPPPYHLAFEADGDYWHRLPGRAETDAIRDTYLLKYHGLPVIRLTESELKTWLL